MSKNGANLERQAGILLPIFSLPSAYGIGNLGKEAYNFVDFLKKSKQKIWQILPIGPTSYGDSPYQSFSAYAGNPYFIDLDKLIEEGYLSFDDIKDINWGDNDTEVNYGKLWDNRYKVLRIAYKNFSKEKCEAFDTFCKENTWLENYTLYMSVKAQFNNKSWLEWDEEIKMYKPEAVEKYREELCDDIKFWAFIQFKFYEQWFKLKDYANKNGIKIIGDIPIYVSMDSAETWAESQQFLLDENHKPTVVAGCPPDSFSEDGQLWGNSIYNWDFMEKDNFTWWRNRIGFSAKIYDVIRIDHFIGIVRYYNIPYGAPNARIGEFKKGPGEKLVKAINESLGDSQIIAEDLGLVTDEVREIMKKSGYPGMKILQHAFDGTKTNEHLPINYDRNCCVYLGTHDNDTIFAAIKNMDDKRKKVMLSYLGKRNMRNIVWELIKLEYASVAKLAVVQMQDILGLDNRARMNVPSTVGGNWTWRVTKKQLSDKIAQKLGQLSEIYGR